MWVRPLIDPKFSLPAGRYNVQVRLISQPSSEAGELFGNCLERSLRNGLEGRWLRCFHLAVGFLKRSGLGRIEPIMRELRERGVYTSFVVGVDLQGTSQEGLSLALQLANKVTIFHDEASDRTFHPKIYLIHGEEKAIAWIGSSNLTQGGLYTNYEMMLELDLDFRTGEDQKAFGSIMGILESYEGNPDLARILSEDLLRELVERDLAVPEKAIIPARAGGPTERAESEPLEPLFGRGRYASPPPMSRASAPSKVPDQPEVVAEAEPAEIQAVEIGCFWKALSHFDVNPDSAPGQIIIPIGFRDEFPPVTLTHGPDAGGHGRQWECSFSVQFIDADGNEHIADDARFIVYEPRTGHARPNTEARFTFRHRDIFELLRQDNILMFQRLDSSPHAFRVRQLVPGGDDYTRLYKGSGRRFGLC
jgi:hypothetical protein